MSYINTLMLPLRAKYPNGFDKNESRNPNIGAWNVFVKQTPALLTEDLRDKIKQSDPGVSVSIPALDATPDADISIRNVRSCSVPFDDGTSRLIAVTFETLVFSIEMTPADFINNDIGYQEAFNRKFEEKAFKVQRLLDSRAVSNLETNKNVFDTGPDKFYTITANDIQVPLAEHDDFYNNLTSIWGEMDFGVESDIVATWTHQPIVNRFVNQGAGNSTNLEFQFQGYDYNFTQRVVQDSNQSVLYAIQPGNLAVETRIDLDSRMGRERSTISESQYWEPTMLPILGFEGGVYYNRECADRSSIQSSLTRSLTESFEFSFDITFLNTLTTDSANRHAPILKADFLTA